MNMLSSVIAIVSIALVGQAMASPVMLASDLYPHRAPSEQLAKEVIEATLNQIDFENFDNVTEIVVDQLYSAKDKDSTELVDGLTIAKLIEQNHVQASDCSQEALKKRHDIVEEAANTERGPGVKYTIHAYLLDTLLHAAQFCVKNKQSVVEHGINDEEWLKGLALSINLSRFTDDPEKDQGHAKIWAQECAYNGFISNIGKYIDTGSNAVQSEYTRANRKDF